MLAEDECVHQGMIAYHFQGDGDGLRELGMKDGSTGHS